ncbi:unnamed protein product [Hermetia illucens]|uniref:Uncharacterized protein n=1 Tax=Hermetia illucens TaxID=343691 RepID=A0A7R8YTJ4_HERIL|nr:unnamed protein product [Hermetia illucens]
MDFSAIANFLRNDFLKPSTYERRMVHRGCRKRKPNSKLSPNAFYSPEESVNLQSLLSKTYESQRNSKNRRIERYLMGRLGAVNKESTVTEKYRKQFNEKVNSEISSCLNKLFGETESASMRSCKQLFSQIENIRRLTTTPSRFCNKTALTDGVPPSCINTFDNSVLPEIHDNEKDEIPSQVEIDNEEIDKSSPMEYQSNTMDILTPNLAECTKNIYTTLRTYRVKKSRNIQTPALSFFKTNVFKDFSLLRSCKSSHKSPAPLIKSTTRNPLLSETIFHEVLESFETFEFSSFPSPVPFPPLVNGSRMLAEGSTLLLSDLVKDMHLKLSEFIEDVFRIMTSKKRVYFKAILVLNARTTINH